jgi:hypothetical protein
MRRTIDQFMWGFQPSFRTSLEGLAERALQGIGAAVAPKGLLVGFASADGARHPICIEPEKGPFTQTDLGGVLTRASELFEGNPRRHWFQTDAELQEQRLSSLRDEARATALCEALGASPGGAERTFFAGVGAPIQGYVVHPIVSVLTARWAALPSLTTGERDRLALYSSLQLAAVRQVLHAATRALRQHRPPQTIGEEPSEVIRTASDRFVDSVVQALLRQFVGSGLKESLDAVAAQPYEGRTGVGTLHLMSREHPHVEVVISFDRAVSVRATRELRKVLEMSAPGLGLLCDGADVYGMGRVNPDFDPSDEDAFLVTVVGRGSWEFVVPAGRASPAKPLLRVDNGQARLPQDRLSKGKFLDSVGRLFPDAPNGSAELLWDLAQACAEQAHGTMLVVHPSASEEGARLQPQALTIEPTHPSPEALLAMTSIDGAVLVAPDAHCHAVGVILDGIATGTGDPARGARYNSAVRYLAGKGEGALIIIVSEDGMINLLPDLRPRRKREDVERAVQRLRAASERSPDYEAFHALVRHVESLQFYLNQEQCDVVNAARKTVEEYRSQTGMYIHFEQMKPDPAMNDSYWL